MITKAELLKKLDNPDYGIEELILWANSLPDDQPHKPCIPVSVIRERIAKETKDWEPDGLNPNYLSGIRDCYKWWGQWLDHQVGQESQPKPGDGWQFDEADPEFLERETVNGLKLQIETYKPWVKVYGVCLGQAHLLGTRPTLDSAKALANEFAEANGGWA